MNSDVDATEVDAVRTEVRGWLASNWKPELTVRAWWALVAEAGWQFPEWPNGLGGRALGPEATAVVREEMAAAGTLGPPFNVGTILGGPVICRHGTPAQQYELLGGLALGTEAWCQFFSEPGAGSDLAGLSARADVNSSTGAWQVNGQKVWSSGAHAADRALLLVRTEHDVPRHGGLSLFIIDTDQPGVDIRPIRQMTGVAGHFNEVFLDDAFVPAGRLIGVRGGGWAVASEILALERLALNVRTPGLVWGTPGAGWGQLNLAAGDVVGRGPEASEYVANRAWVDARRLATLTDPSTRSPLLGSQLAMLAAMDQLIAQTAARRPVVPGGANIAKLHKTIQSRLSAQIAGASLGPHAQLMLDDATFVGELAHLQLVVPSFSIAGGTDEIQRNVLGERVLGLPREPNPGAQQ